MFLTVYLLNHFEPLQVFICLALNLITVAAVAASRNVKQRILILWFVSFHTETHAHFFIHIHACNQRYQPAN